MCNGLKFVEAEIDGFVKKSAEAEICECVNLLYTGGLFHCYMLDKSICHFRVSSLFCHFNSILDGKSCWQTM